MSKMQLHAMCAALIGGYPWAALGDEPNAATKDQGSRRLAEALQKAQEGKPKDALQIIRSAALSPELAPLGAAIEGSLCEKLGDDGSAFEAYRRFPNDMLLVLRLGVLHYRRGDTHLARQQLLAVWNASPSAEAAYYLGVMAQRHELFEEARTWFIRAVAYDALGVAGWREKASAALVKVARLSTERPEP